MNKRERFWSALTLLHVPVLPPSVSTTPEGDGTDQQNNYRHRQWQTAAPIVFLGVFIITVLSIRSTATFLMSPIDGNVAAQSMESVSAIDLTPTTATNNYATFTYPRNMITRKSQVPHYPVLASYNLTYQTLAPWSLAISIIRVPTGNLADNNAYRFRLINPQTFVRTQIKLKDKTATIMTDESAGGYARVGFLVHGQYQAVISLTGEDRSNMADLQSTLNMVLGSWHWQKG